MKQQDVEGILASMRAESLRVDPRYTSSVGIREQVLELKKKAVLTSNPELTGMVHFYDKEADKVSSIAIQVKDYL